MEAAGMPSTTTEEPSQTWTCEVCSLENDEPDAESLLKAGGIVSCELCLKVRGQGAIESGVVD